ncbi:glycosyltransferase family 2 protein [Falsiroseomonas tokyonensis]|uniref:Glycosyltransferase family 2 protein n=1 Tax=Falsiroseomonas tokyonensis TaxID=430521 RepID=A0ABV7BXD2_9PROT|nr:glycosyltransferase family A protein [Falsiroseomonas tokyonensis]MBU8538706.1 glycosyltransferase [Falsiroseomonas tokyonensis]
MIHFSLIVATRGRTTELVEFLDSVTAQGRADIEVIVVDQNEDGRLAPLLAPYTEALRITHLRSSIARANHARNLGLRQARGALVSFPDDDCLYPPGLLDRVANAFAADPALMILTGPAESPEGGLGSGRWRVEGGPITAANAWTSVIEFNLWLRRGLALRLGGYDETMGPGTGLGSAEGNDLVLRAVTVGHKAIYDPSLRIIHPDKRLSEVAVARAWLYGGGLGFALRRHSVPASVWLPFAIRPIGGLALSLLRLRPRDAAYYGMTFLGRLRGFARRDATAGRIRPAIEGQPEEDR